MRVGWPAFLTTGCSLEKSTGSEERVRRDFGEAVCSGTAPLIRRLRGRVDGGSNHPWCSIAYKPGRAQGSLYPEGSRKKRCKMLKTNTFPADAQPPGEKCGLGRMTGRIIPQIIRRMGSAPSTPTSFWSRPL